MKKLTDVNPIPQTQSLPVIQSERDLRHIIPAYPKMLDKRIKHSLDQFSIEFIDVAKVVIVATSSKHGVMFPLHCKPDGLRIGDNQHLIIRDSPNKSLDQGDDYPLVASLYFLIPGIGHALRINGILTSMDQYEYKFSINQVYFHCSRAAVRADLWISKPGGKLEQEQLIGHSSYLLLKTQSSEGRIEISPRGGEPGFVKRISSTTLMIPEFPGNKVAVSLRNIISCPDVELFFIVPGTNNTLNIKGSAELISSCEQLDQCAVKGKIPKVGIIINIQSSQFQLDPVLASRDIWDSEKAISKDAITSFPKALSSHINGKGLLGKVTHTIVGAVVKHDLKNLY